MPNALSVRAQGKGAKASAPPASVARASAPSASVPWIKRPTLNIFIGGAADSSLGKAVKSYQPSIPSSRYYTWDKKSAILSDIKKLPPGTCVNLIGHSWGGDTAVAVASECSRKISLLITIDPVGARIDPPFSSPVSPATTPGKTPKKTTWQERAVAHMKAARPNVVMWINVDACPDKAERDYTDAIADIGGKWGELARPYANSFIRAYHLNHADFRRMMNYSAEGSKNPKTTLLESMR